MSRHTKKNWTHRAAKIIVILVVLDAIVYVGVDQPLQRLLAREQQRFTITRHRAIRHSRARPGLSKR